MKPTALDTLLIAKSILGEATNLIGLADRHSSTAGIILLQDFVELVVLALLDELDADNVKNLESKSFDELLGELKKNDIPVIKSGTIKALNKQRVICKHYGQLCEPASVTNYLNTALLFSDAALQKVYGKSLQEIFVTDILNEGPIKLLIGSSIIAANCNNFFEALSGLRKAFFLAYEFEYCIYDARNDDQARPSFSALLELRGRKALAWIKNKAWIDQNVRTPLDFIQINYDQLKTDCLEFGCSVVDVENFRRLTPRMVELEHTSWHSDYDTNYAANELNIENFNYCLDALLGFLLSKQRFDSRHKWPKRVKAAEMPPIYIGKPVHHRPDQTSTVIVNVPANFLYTIDRYVSGFNTNEKYYYVHLFPQGSAPLSLENHYWGYLLAE